MALRSSSIIGRILKLSNLQNKDTVCSWNWRSYFQRPQHTKSYPRFCFQNHSRPKMDGSLNAVEPAKPVLQPILFPPPHPGMTILDKNAFRKVITVPTVVVPHTRVGTISETLKPFFLKLSKFRSVQKDPSDITKKRIYLNPDVVPPVSSELLEFLQQQLKMSGEEVMTVLSPEAQELTITYENWFWWDILNAVIPHEFEKARSFTTVGPLLHLNLRNHLLPYKHIIAQVLLDGVPAAKTVVNKVNTIDTTYRNFQMEVLAGEPSTIVKVKECGTEFEFDFATVYWNSRLSAEHERINCFLQPGDFLFDVFAGVGPFALPAAKKRCFVYANDLNPESYRWLVHNINKTKKVKGYVKAFNLDGREFILKHLPPLLQKPREPVTDFEDLARCWTKKIHVTMNLPAIASEFLDVFWGLAAHGDTELNPDVIMTVHVYCFIKATVEVDQSKSLALELINRNLRYQLPKENVVEVFFVRNVAPNKNMHRVSFIMPNEILLAQSIPLQDNGNPAQQTVGDQSGENSGPPTKRQKSTADDDELNY